MVIDQHKRGGEYKQLVILETKQNNWHFYRTCLPFHNMPICCIYYKLISCCHILDVFEDKVGGSIILGRGSFKDDVMQCPKYLSSYFQVIFQTRPCLQLEHCPGSRGLSVMPTILAFVPRHLERHLALLAILMNLCEYSLCIKLWPANVKKTEQQCIIQGYRLFFAVLKGSLCPLTRMKSRKGMFIGERVNIVNKENVMQGKSFMLKESKFPPT